MWPDRRLVDLFGTECPIEQAPLAGANDALMGITVSEAGAFGSLSCAMLDVERMRAEIHRIR